MEQIHKVFLVLLLTLISRYNCLNVIDVSSISDFQITLQDGNCRVCVFLQTDKNFSLAQCSKTEISQKFNYSRNSKILTVTNDMGFKFGALVEFIQFPDDVFIILDSTGEDKCITIDPASPTVTPQNLFQTCDVRYPLSTQKLILVRNYNNIVLISSVLNLQGDSTPFEIPSSCNLKLTKSGITYPVYKNTASTTRQFLPRGIYNLSIENCEYNMVTTSINANCSYSQGSAIVVKQIPKPSFSLDSVNNSDSKIDYNLFVQKFIFKNPAEANLPYNSNIFIDNPIVKISSSYSVLDPNITYDVYMPGYPNKLGTYKSGNTTPISYYTRSTLGDAEIQPNFTMFRTDTVLKTASINWGTSYGNWNNMSYLQMDCKSGNILVEFRQYWDESIANSMSHKADFRCMSTTRVSTSCQEDVTAGFGTNNTLVPLTAYGNMSILCNSGYFLQSLIYEGYNVWFVRIKYRCCTVDLTGLTTSTVTHRIEGRNNATTIKEFTKGFLTENNFSIGIQYYKFIINGSHRYAEMQSKMYGKYPTISSFISGPVGTNPAVIGCSSINSAISLIQYQSSSWTSMEIQCTKPYSTEINQCTTKSFIQLTWPAGKTGDNHLDSVGGDCDPEQVIQEIRIYNIETVNKYVKLEFKCCNIEAIGYYYQNTQINSFSTNLIMQYFMVALRPGEMLAGVTFRNTSNTQFLKVKVAIGK